MCTYNSWMCTEFDLCSKLLINKYASSATANYIRVSVFVLVLFNSNRKKKYVYLFDFTFISIYLFCWFSIRFKIWISYASYLYVFFSSKCSLQFRETCTKKLFRQNYRGETTMNNKKKKQSRAKTSCQNVKNDTSLKIYILLFVASQYLHLFLSIWCFLQFVEMFHFC